MYWKDENKEKEAGNGPFKKMSKDFSYLYNNVFCHDYLGELGGEVAWNTSRILGQYNKEGRYRVFISIWHCNFRLKMIKHFYATKIADTKSQTQNRRHKIAKFDVEIWCVNACLQNDSFRVMQIAKYFDKIVSSFKLLQMRIT